MTPKASVTASSPAPAVIPTPTLPSILPGDWSSYLLGNNGFNADETTINPTTASALQPYWTYHAEGGITDQPIVVNGMIYWGSWDGLEHATNVKGQQVWATYLGKTIDNDPDCDPSDVGIASTAAVAPVLIHGSTTLVLFVGGGDANFYALNASSGQVIWKISLGSSPEHFIWSSPVIYKGSVYFGVASFGDCPSIQGQLVQASTVDGSIQNIFDVVPNGCIGGSVWGSPTIDRDTGEIFIATGNTDTCWTTEVYAVSMIKLKASDLSVMSSWQVPQSQWVDDSDFGTTPTLFSATIEGTLRSLVGAINKNGIFYAFDRNAISDGPVWSFQVADDDGSIAPAAWDGSKLYVAGGQTYIGGNLCQGSLRALDPATGNITWERCLTDSRDLAPVTVIPGLVTDENGHSVDVRDTRTGNTLFHYKDSNSSSIFYGAATVAHGMLYVGNMDGNLYAFGLYHSSGQNVT